MKRPVFYSSQSQEDLEEIRAYLFENFGMVAATKFLGKINKAVKRLESHPESNPSTKKHPGLRRCIIPPYTIMFYQLKSDEVEIVAIIDARRDSFEVGK